MKKTNFSNRPSNVNQHLKLLKTGPGRPPLKNTVKVTILASETALGLSKNDLAIGVESALKRSFPGVKIIVQTTQRLQKMGIAYDFYGINDIIRLNGYPLKFPWELRDYMTNFASYTKGTEDFSFDLKIPKHWGIKIN